MKYISFMISIFIAANLIAKDEVKTKKDSASAPAKEAKQVKELKDFDSKLAHKLVEKEGALLLDVRTLIEHKFSSLPNSKRIHVGDLDEKIGKVKKWVKNDLDHPIVVFCAAGVRAKKAKAILKKHGFTRVMNLGGISDW